MNGRPAPDDRLSGYVDGELDDGERAAVDALLAESPEWRGVLAKVQWSRDSVRALPWHEAPAGFWDDVALEGLGATAPHRWRHPFRVIAGAAAAAAVVAALLVPLEERAERDPASSSSERSTVQRDADDGDDGTGLLEDLIAIALDPFDW